MLWKTVIIAALLAVGSTAASAKTKYCLVGQIEINNKTEQRVTNVRVDGPDFQNPVNINGGNTPKFSREVYPGQIKTFNLDELDSSYDGKAFYLVINDEGGEKKSCKKDGYVLIYNADDSSGGTWKYNAKYDGSLNCINADSAVKNCVETTAPAP